MLDWKNLVAKTDLLNKNEVVEELNRLQVSTLGRLDNLPGNYGRPFFCGNATGAVVAKLRAAYSEAAAEVPTIEEVIEAVPEPEEPKREVIGASKPVSELEIDGVKPAQLKAIEKAGIGTVGELFEKSDELKEVSGIGEATELRILTAVTEVLENQ